MLSKVILKVCYLYLVLVYHILCYKVGRAVVLMVWKIANFFVDRIKRMLMTPQQIIESLREENQQLRGETVQLRGENVQLRDELEQNKKQEVTKVERYYKKAKKIPVVGMAVKPFGFIFDVVETMRDATSIVNSVFSYDECKRIFTGALCTLAKILMIYHSFWWMYVTWSTLIAALKNNNTAVLKAYNGYRKGVSDAITSYFKDLYKTKQMTYGVTAKLDFANQVKKEVQNLFTMIQDDSTTVAIRKVIATMMLEQGLKEIEDVETSWVDMISTYFTRDIQKDKKAIEQTLASLKKEKITPSSEEVSRVLVTQQDNTIDLLNSALQIIESKDEVKAEISLQNLVNVLKVGVKTVYQPVVSVAQNAIGVKNTYLFERALDAPKKVFNNIELFLTEKSGLGSHLMDRDSFATLKNKIKRSQETFEEEYTNALKTSDYVYWSNVDYAINPPGSQYTPMVYTFKTLEARSEHEPSVEIGIRLNTALILFTFFILILTPLFSKISKKTKVRSMINMLTYGSPQVATTIRR